MAKRIITVLVCSLFIVSGFIYAAPGVNDLLAEIDEMMDLESDGTAKVKITQQKAGEGSRFMRPSII